MTTSTHSNRIDAPDDPAELFDFMVDAGYTDGLPVIPPSERYVRAMIDSVRRSGDEVIAVAPNRGPR